MQHTSLPCKPRTIRNHGVSRGCRTGIADRLLLGEPYMPRAQQTVSVVGCDDRTPKSWLTASAVAALLPLLALYAPHRALAAAAEAGEELQEVVVTAEKRSSTVQETPISL
jgi:hypothetical protein